MKNKIIIFTLSVLIIIIGYIFVNTLVEYIKISKERDETVNNESTNLEPENKTDNNIFKVDENSSIRIITEYDENMFKGHKSLIFFWASWCSHCKEEYDVVKTVIENYQGRGYNIYIVSHDYKINDLSDFMKNNDFNYEVYFDEQRIIRANFDPEASSIPLTYIIDENARLIASHEGAITLGELDNLINENI